MTFARIAPLTQPATWVGTYAATWRHEMPPNAASTSETTGLRCAPETGPTTRMIA